MTIMDTKELEVCAGAVRSDLVRGSGMEGFFDLGTGDIFAASDDDVFGAIQDEDEAVVVHLMRIADDYDDVDQMLLWVAVAMMAFAAMLPTTCDI